MITNKRCALAASASLQMFLFFAPKDAEESGRSLGQKNTAEASRRRRPLRLSLKEPARPGLRTLRGGWGDSVGLVIHREQSRKSGMVPRGYRSNTFPPLTYRSNNSIYRAAVVTVFPSVSDIFNSKNWQIWFGRFFLGPYLINIVILNSINF